VFKSGTTGITGIVGIAGMHPFPGHAAQLMPWHWIVITGMQLMQGHTWQLIPLQLLNLLHIEVVAT